MKKIIFLTGLFSIFNLNANNVEINIEKHTEANLAKINCNLLKKGDIKTLSRHFTGERKDWINSLSLEELENVSSNLVNRYGSADCSYIDLKVINTTVKAYPYASKWNFTFTYDEDNQDWNITNY
jgi:hypothetical protein